VNPIATLSQLGLLPEKVHERTDEETGFPQGLQIRLGINASGDSDGCRPLRARIIGFKFWGRDWRELLGRGFVVQGGDLSY
jgi:hypothetical protein